MIKNKSCHNWLKTHLYKVINHRQGYDDDGEHGCGQTDDEERPDNAQKTENPGAETLGDGLVHCEYILQDEWGHSRMHHGSYVEFCGVLDSSMANITTYIVIHIWMLLVTRTLSTLLYDREGVGEV